ncbi:MAG: hypothetical protein IPP72_20825 [Chitinophagaceae bacterium]|nr:hypothetical protein [Chitinophagaceae bacterium]
MNKLLLTAILFTSLAATAQVQPAKKPPVATQIVKFKPPVVKTFLAKFTGSNATCSAEEGKQIITLPLRIVDANNNAYAISSYQLAYTRLAVKEDEATGETSPTTSLIAQRFTETPIAGIWKTSIIEQLQKGEELFFFDIIVLDKQGRRFFAPDLKLTIQ